MQRFLEDKRILTQLECFPCFLRQTLICLDAGDYPEQLRQDVMRNVLEEARHADMNESPAHFTSGMHRRIRGMLGDDPYVSLKARYNRIAMELYTDMKRTIKQSSHRLSTAARLAVAGNIIDFGIFRFVDIDGTIHRALNEPFIVDHSEQFEDAVREADKVLYLLDNAGEIVFDRLLIEELVRRGKRVTAVVKGSPVLNDCTMADAGETGITQLCEVLDNGSDAVGTILEMVSDEFRQRFHENGTLIISKGQGNFETLLGSDRNIFYLFQSKCEVVSRTLDVPEGAMLLVGQ